ncbi:MAG: CocE/NonD family hydrolase [bacterium]
MKASHIFSAAAAARICSALLLSAILVCAGYNNAAAMDKKTEMVMMPDGVRLATDIYLPKTDKKVPVVLIRTTYGRESMVNMLLPFFEGKNIAIAMQDTRGRYGSEGASSAFVDDPKDGYETVEWLAAQPWSNGKVGTAGISALGITQYLMDKNAPPHLVCQDVMAAPPSLYHTIVYPGGAVRRALFFGWVIGQNYPMSVMQLILSQVDYSDMWRMMDLSVDYDKVNVPIMHMAGWYDLYLDGQLEAFSGIQENGAPGARGKQRLIVGPWTHAGFLGLAGTKQVTLDYPANSVYSMTKVIDWFQECLKGQDKGFMSGPAVRYYVMGDPEDPKAPGNVWRKADAWPVPAKITPFYFHKDGLLSDAKPAGAQDSLSYVDDPWHPVPTLGSDEHAKERHPVDLRPIESRSDVLVFSTPVLDKPVEVTGQITAKLFFTTDVVDTDFIVRISDVYPDGRSMLVTDGIIRASHRESVSRRVPLKPGEPYEVDIEVWPTSIIFNKGHKIRVSVSSTYFPRFDVNYHTGQYHNATPAELEKARATNITKYVYIPNPPADAKIANTTISLSASRPSQILLPLAPE